MSGERLLGGHLEIRIGRLDRVDSSRLWYGMVWGKEKVG
jgi:hypothetical protein